MTRELDKVFTKKGDVFTQIAKSDNYYIYERNMGDVVYYEVFERNIVKLNDFWRQYDKNGKFDGYDDFVQYPNDEHFGKWAYCCRTLEKAQKRALEFTN
jgi:hypothetical protein